MANSLYSLPSVSLIRLMNNEVPTSIRDYFLVTLVKSHSAGDLQCFSNNLLSILWTMMWFWENSCTEFKWSALPQYPEHYPQPAASGQLSPGRGVKCNICNIYQISNIYNLWLLVIAVQARPAPTISDR